MRRADSEMLQKIEALIEEEQDPRERVRLLILYQISTILSDNVSAIRDTKQQVESHLEEYDKHVKLEESYINQGKGMWRVLGSVLVVAQGVLGYLYYEHVDSVRSLQVTVAAISKEQEITRERHRVEDRVGRQP